MNSLDAANPQVLWILGICVLILLGATVYLFYAFLTKEETIQQMKKEHNRLMRSFNDLDEQAKLIVRTDLELNRAQEELDKRLNGLNALQRTSHQISQALNESEIFQKVSLSLFENLVFARALIATVDDGNHLRIRLNAGFKEPRAIAILKEFEDDERLIEALKEPKTLSSINCSHKTKEKLLQTFESEHFIFSSVLTQSGSVGFVFVGNRYTAPPVVQSDEELISILAGQIGQSIENAQLFEKVFRSSQELEIKVRDRTKQLAGALEKVEDISRKKTEFISAVSHELRTPLTSIKGYAVLLMAGKIGEVPPAVKERLAKINAHSDNLVSLINNLLDIARIESGRQEMKFSVYKIKAIVDGVADMLNPQISAKGIKLQLIIPEEITEVYVDASQIERVFINLLSNAIKFTPPNGTITVKASPGSDKGYVVFNVSDTGIGIPASEIQKLFSEFFRVDNEINQNVKGTGLGLVLAKNIVQAHRGKIWVQSTPGTGTTFYFTLPICQATFEDNKPLTTAAP